MSIFNRVLYGVIAILLVTLVLTGYSNFKLKSEVTTLNSENKELQAANANLSTSLDKATKAAVRNNTTNIRQSKARANAKATLNDVLQEARNASSNEPAVTLSPVQLDGLRNLVNKANSTISAASDTE